MTIHPAFPAALLALALVGCSATYDQDFFDYDRNQSRTRQIMEAQYARAAAEEGSLRPGHFDESADGPVLNALGRQRADLILAGRSAGGPVRVWIDAPSHLALDADAMAEGARAYLLAAGVDPDLLVVRMGPGPTRANAGPMVMAHQEMGGMPTTGSDGGDTDTTPGLVRLGGLFGEQ